VLDAIEQGVVALDRERKVLYANRWIQDLLGLEPEALIGMGGARLFPGADARWLKGAAREPRDFKLEAEGREMTLKAEAMPLRDEEGDVMGSVILAEAISETEDGEFQKKIDRLVSLGELSAYVAHEIRNPLTGIRTTVQFVASKLKPQDPRKEDLDDVIKELDRIELIISGLLQFARPQSGRPGPTDVSQLVGRVLDNLELQFKGAGVTIERDFAGEPAHVWTDPDLLQQVVLNLSINAMQALSGNGGGNLKVSLGIKRYRTKKSMVDLVFADDGPGPRTWRPW
jgi:two-component system sensor histidine kinase HydH